MLLHVAAVLNTTQARQWRERLLAADAWVDGRRTVGEQGARVKHNRQLDAASALGRELGAALGQSLATNASYFSASLPQRMTPALFNRYEHAGEGGGEHYGRHIDGAVMAAGGAGTSLRSDVSATLFLAEPDSYDGGELVVHDTYGSHEVKLPAGDLVLYPSTSVHEVLPVTRGVRLAAFFWVQSLVRDDTRRALLFELDRTIQSLRVQLGETAETVSLTGHYHNLLRQWAEL